MTAGRLVIAYRPEIQVPRTIYYVINQRFDCLVWGIMAYVVGDLLQMKCSRVKFMSRPYLLTIVVWLLLGLPLTLSYFLGGGLMPVSEARALYAAGRPVIGVCFFIVVLIGSEDSNAVARFNSLDRVLLWLGTRSYNLYVLHFPVFIIIWMLVPLVNTVLPVLWQLNPFYYRIIQLCLFVALGLPLSNIAWRKIEVPGIALGNRIIRSGTANHQ